MFEKRLWPICRCASTTSIVPETNTFHKIICVETCKVHKVVPNLFEIYASM